ncbi:DUF4831 family protein [uncultured Bacteroides sp.]|uniref:DUF4831 family protein n=1 Tax=uncultured Bacteroides sp. TaxID=162156 RepID=UPI002614DB55|nr:DUF4831 family protein [uncultured Bacteroides sp.]
MKKTIVTLGLLSCLTPVWGQDVSAYIPGDEGIVYFLPKTALEVNVIATHVTYQPGELCQYANRYLRLTDVSDRPADYWEIKQIDVRPVGIPDSSKVYTIKLKDKALTSNVELTKDGLVKAINTNGYKEEKTDDYQLETKKEHENPRKYMTEDALMAGSSAKMAELIAEDIYNIRDSKNLILRGQADNMPKDGESLKLVIDNLEKQERAMTEMFTGTTDREDKLFSVRILPENRSEKIALRFSKELGVLDAENLAGDPIYISVNSIAPLPTIEEEPDSKKKKKLGGVIYNIPGKGYVSATFKGKEYFQKELPIVQFGTTEVLVEDLFSKKINTRVIFDPETGRILKIDKD